MDPHTSPPTPATPADDAPQTPATEPETEHMGATEDAVVPITSPQDDGTEDAVGIDPADEITPG